MPYELILAMVGGGALTAVINNLTQLLLHKINRKATKEDREAIFESQLKGALCNLFYERIHHLADKYIDANEIRIGDLEALIKLHTSYKNDLGGNGFLDELMSRVKELPTK
jgi:hypothetical protein